MAVDFSSIGGVPVKSQSIDFSSVEAKQPTVDYGQVVKDALNEAQMGNGSKMRALLTDPVTQAKALPYLTGFGFSALGVPLGASAGLIGGRQLSNAALRTYGHPEEIPSNTQQMIEGGGALAGDALAIPAINKKLFGFQIGAAEKAAGVPPVQDIPSTPMALGQKTVGEFINDAVDSVKNAGSQPPAFWKQIKDQVDRIYNLGKDQGLTSLDQGRLKFLNGAVQSGLNQAVPGRAAPAAALAMSQKVPNFISNVAGPVPWWLKAVGTAVGGDALLRALGNRGSR